MTNELNFLGMGISIGQSHPGVAKAHLNILQYKNTIRHMGMRFIDCGEVSQTHEVSKVRSNEELIDFDWKSYKEAHLACKKLLNERNPLLNWGGDHSIAISTVSAFCSEHVDGKVIWIDAHADSNLPAYSPSGNIHGMPLAFLMNLEGVGAKYFPWMTRFLKPENLIYIGLREIDDFEKSTLKSLKIKYFTAVQIQELGMKQVAKELVDLTGSSPLHISFDIDSVCPEFAPSTGLHVPGGLKPHELFTLGKALSSESRIHSMDVVEINPTIGTKEEVAKTNVMALGFVQSLFVKENFNWKESYHDNCRASEKFHTVETQQSL